MEPPEPESVVHSATGFESFFSNFGDELVLRFESVAPPEYGVELFFCRKQADGSIQIVFNAMGSGELLIGMPLADVERAIASAKKAIRQRLPDEDE